MAKVGSKQTVRPAMTPEAEESQMISLAMDVAKQRLLDGTASSQLVTHFLKLGSAQAALERDILALKKDLIKAKTEQIQSAKEIEALYSDAIKAMSIYNGSDKSEAPDEDQDLY